MFNGIERYIKNTFTITEQGMMTIFLPPFKGRVITLQIKQFRASEVRYGIQ
jgi:hypothetical protein